MAPALDRRAHGLVHRPGHLPRRICGTTSTRKEKLSHYSKRTVDIEYNFGFAGGDGWGELEGIANRTDFDLGTHSQHSGTDLSYFEQATGERYLPYVIEPAAGLTRSLMAFLVEAYTEDEAPNTKGGVDTRTVLKLDPRLSPVKAAVLPLSRNADLSPKARDLAAQLRKIWNVEFDDAQAIGRRYRRQDEIGTPVLRHGRLRHARRRCGHDPRARHDDAGAGRPRPGAVLPRRPADRLLTARAARTVHTQVHSTPMDSQGPGHHLADAWWEGPPIGETPGTLR